MHDRIPAMNLKSWLRPFLVLNLLLVALAWQGLPGTPWVAVEAILLLWLLWLIPSAGARKAIIAASAVLLASLAVIAAGDPLIRQSLGRSFNLYLELGLVAPTINLLTTNLGLPLALLVMLLLGGIAVALVWLFQRLLNHQLAVADNPASRRRLSWSLLIPAGALVFSALPQVPIAPTASAMVANQVSLARASHQASRDFRAHIESQLRDNPGFGGQAAPLPGLADRDVLMGFIESYGISALTDERYEPLIRPRLDAMARSLEDAGLHVVSGRLEAPIQGGQSWLAHATLLSGLWVSNQLKYEVLLTSGYPTLIDDFRVTGHDTVAVMPAITRAWPEGDLLGYDRVYDSVTMDYEGPPFNWVTMPDQYTWSWFEHQVRSPAGQPLFAELALISSHAPWVPILPVLDDWGSIGNGEVFLQWEGTGEAPASLWRDHDRVREHFALAVDYALEVATGYITRYLDDNTLLILLGDHQPAPLITGEGASRDAIVHVISADPALLEPFVTSRGGLPSFRMGTVPDLTVPGPRMDVLRPFLHRHFGAGL